MGITTRRLALHTWAGPTGSAHSFLQVANSANLATGLDRTDD